MTLKFDFFPVCTFVSIYGFNSTGCLERIGFPLVFWCFPLVFQGPLGAESPRSWQWTCSEISAKRQPLSPSKSALPTRRRVTGKRDGERERDLKISRHQDDVFHLQFGNVWKRFKFDGIMQTSWSVLGWQEFPAQESNSTKSTKCMESCPIRIHVEEPDSYTTSGLKRVAKKALRIVQFVKASNKGRGQVKCLQGAAPFNSHQTYQQESHTLMASAGWPGVPREQFWMYNVWLIFHIMFLACFSFIPACPVILLDRGFSKWL